MDREELTGKMIEVNRTIFQTASTIRQILDEEMKDDYELQSLTIHILKDAIEQTIQIRDYSYMQSEEE